MLCVICECLHEAPLMFSGVGAAELPGAVTGAVRLSGPAAVGQPLPRRYRSSKRGARASHGQELPLLLSRKVGVAP